MPFVPVQESWFQGAISLENTPDGIHPWRIPHGQRVLFSEGLVGRAARPSGVRMRLTTDAAELTVKAAIVEPEEDPVLWDVTVGGDLVCTDRMADGAAAFTGLPAGEKTVDIWLPQFARIAVAGMEVPDGASLAPAADDRGRWVTYGSSITHCRAAHSPARTWPATAARLRNLHLTSLGFGGECHLEPLLGMTIRDLPADVISLKLGINTHGGSLGGRTYPELAIGLVRIIREEHPVTPIALISPILSPPREQKRASGSSLTLREMREHLQRAAERLREAGDENVHYFSGLELFGEDLAATCLPDNLHPNGDGYEAMGRNFAERVLEKLGF